MNYIDHPLLYSDDFINHKWDKISKMSNSHDVYWRKYARRKMRRITKELLVGVRPRISMGWLI